VASASAMAANSQQCIGRCRWLILIYRHTQLAHAAAHAESVCFGAGLVLLVCPGNLHVTEVDEDEDEWQDPSGGILVNIFAACEEGDAEALEVNLQDLPNDVADKAAPYSINTPGPDGDTALHLACLYGHLQCVQKLLDAGSSPNAINPEDKTSPLHDAAAGGYLDLLQLLIAKGGADVLQQQDMDGDTALHNAARGGHPAVVQYLLQQGANPALRNAAGHTAAEEADEPEVARLSRRQQMQRPRSSSTRSSSH